tara:strand:+ start:1982 stop:2281 length:300 start_codon:yes stop_codon:yes gene_type:complete
MKKQVRRFEVKFDFDWEDGVEISKIREDLNALEKLGATHVGIDPYVNYDCASVSFDGYVNRQETDEEYLKRTTEQLDRESRTKQRDLAELKRLKDKYKD